MTVQKSCVICGAGFVTSLSCQNQRCCGDKCARKLQAITRTKQPEERTCIQCGRAFMAKRPCDPHRFCSFRCGKIHSGELNRQRFSAPSRVKNCEQCGAAFTIRECPSYSGRRFCSKSCSAASRRGIIAYNRGNRVKATCIWCKKEVEVLPKVALHFRCCSKECDNARRRTIKGTIHPLYKEKSRRVCEWCGTEFWARAAGQKRHCSRKCVGFTCIVRQRGRKSSIEFAVEAVLEALGEPFISQKQIGPWLVDFYLPNRNLVIECDGKYWHGLPRSQARDRQKDGWMKANGYQIIRLGEDDINRDAAGLVSEALSA